MGTAKQAVIFCSHGFKILWCVTVSLKVKSKLKEKFNRDLSGKEYEKTAGEQLDSSVEQYP